MEICIKENPSVSKKKKGKFSQLTKDLVVEGIRTTKGDMRFYR